MSKQKKKATSTSINSSKEEPPSKMRWSLEEEIAKLTADVLEESYPDLKDEKPMTLRCKEKYGDYQCENVLSIWPKLRSIKPVSVGERIKKFLGKRHDMVQRVPCVRDIGFVTFKLSDSWIAKSIHKMLRHGIGTWAPKLPVKRVIIHTPSIAGEGTADDSLRLTCIKDAIYQMLYYSEVDVSFSGSGSKSEVCTLTENELNSCFLTGERDGDAVIYGKAEGEPIPLIRVKCEEGLSHAFKDLGAFWNGLVNKNADWMVCLAPACRREYIKMCFNAAEHARWISPDRYYGLSYAGHATESLKTTIDSPFIECALKYTYLKNNRFSECTIVTDEMLGAEGNTLFYLAITFVRVSRATDGYYDDIEKLKKDSKWTLGDVEAWKEKGHALGLHLLRFTEVVKQACLSFLPHILCDFFYELSEKFNNYNSLYTSMREVKCVTKTGRLLLCNATWEVMMKCFELLGLLWMRDVDMVGILINDEAWAFGCLSYLRQRYRANEQNNHVITPVSVARDPPRNSRFELIAVGAERLGSFKKGKVFGSIIASDEYGVRPDGWVPIYQPDCGYVSLLNCDWFDAEDMIKHGRVYPRNPSSHHTVPLSPSFSIRMELFVETEENDSFFQLGYEGRELDFSEFVGKNAPDGACQMLSVKGKDFVAHLYYILLKDAVDISLQVTFHWDVAPDQDGLQVHGGINAFYGEDFPYSSDVIVKSFYKAPLFKPDVGYRLCDGPMKLKKSALAAPRNGSLIIEANLRAVGSRKLIVDKNITFTFEEAINCINGKGCSGVKLDRIMGEGCHLEVKVHWNYNKGQLHKAQLH